MSSPTLNLSAAELKAIEEHKYFLAQSRGSDVTIEEAIADFVEKYAADWRREKLRLDNLDQRQEIEKHQYLRSQEAGRDIGRSSAAEEWCQKYAHIWRAERESLEKNGFHRLRVTVHDAAGLHLRPASTVAELAKKYDCDLYVHRPGMNFYNFMLEGLPYRNVRSVIGVLSLGAACGDTLDFIATGNDAEAALAALAELLSHRGSIPGA
ncbi:MAG: HPr family phosphocarrier protein [Verrucomicrobiota bacterium]